LYRDPSIFTAFSERWLHIMQPLRLVSSVLSAVELQGLQKCDEGFFLLGREIQPKAVPLH